MDKNCPTRHLTEESNSSPDAEGSPNPRIRPNVRRISLGCIALDQSLKEASAPPAEYNDAFHETSNSSSDAESMPRSQNQPNITRISLECARMDQSAKEDATVTAEYVSAIPNNDFENVPIKKNEMARFEISSMETSKTENKMEANSQCDKIPVSSKSSERQVIDSSQKKKFSTNAGSTTETQENAAGWYAVSETEQDLPEDTAAKALELEYMNKYANEHSKELIFAVDIMSLVRHLNKLECRYIIYGTVGIAPTSPCDDNLDQVLGKMWGFINQNFGHILKSQMKNKGIDYQCFQKIMLNMAEKEELGEYDEKSFLTYCLVLAQWAVCAESNGVKSAHEFIPLVICRTIQNLKDSGKLPSNFWERIAQKALNIGSEFEQL